MMNNKYTSLLRRSIVVWPAFAVCCYYPLWLIFTTLYSFFILDFKGNFAIWVNKSIFLVIFALTLIGIAGYRSSKLWGRIWAGCVFLIWMLQYIFVTHFIVTGNWPFYPDLFPKPTVINWGKFLLYSVFVLTLIAGIVTLALPQAKTKSKPLA